MPKQKQTAQPKEAAHFLPTDHTKLLKAAQRKSFLAAQREKRELEHTTCILVGNDTASRLAAAAQFLGIHDRDELAQIALHAFLEMYDDDHWITFPLMLQQVDTMQ